MTKSGYPNKAFVLIGDMSWKTLFILFTIVTILNTPLLKAQEIKNDTFKHSLFFWLKTPDKEAFEKSIKKFTDNSIYVQSKHLRIPAKTNWDVVDNTYTYCLQVTFNNKEDHYK